MLTQYKKPIMLEIEEFPEKWELKEIELYYLISIISILIIFSLNLLFPPTDANSVRYMLSALVQSEAAIIAVVVSLSLLGVQLVASSYSSRVIQVFKSAQFFWLLLLYYIAVMAIGMWVLMGIKDQDFSCLWVAISYSLGILAFLALVPYIWKVLELISPYTLIDRISTNITNESILSTKITGERNDPIQPIMDIIIGSLEKHDEGIIIHGLNIIKSKTSILFNTASLDARQDISFIFLHLSAIGKLSSSKNDEYATIKIIETIGEIAYVAEDNGLIAPSAKAIKSLEEIGSSAAERRLSDPTSLTLGCLKKAVERITDPAVKKKYCEFALEVLLSIEKIGEIAVDQKLNEVIESEISAIETIAVLLIKQDYNVAYKSIEIIEKVGTASIDLDILEAPWYAAFSLKNIGIEASKKANEHVANGAAGSLGSLGDKIIQYLEEITPKYAVEDKLNEKSATIVSIIDNIAEALSEVGLSGIKYRIDGPVRISALSIFRIRHKSMEILRFDYQRRSVADQLRDYLEEIKAEAQSSPSPEIFRETIEVIERFHIDDVTGA
jgi:hypothetical protein